MFCLKVALYKKTKSNQAEASSIHSDQKGIFSNKVFKWCSFQLYSSQKVQFINCTSFQLGWIHKTQ